MSRITLGVPLIALLAATGCAQRPASLDQARTALQSARSDPDVSTYAAAELDAAQTQLKSANDAWEQGEGQAEAAHRADLAMSRVQIAQASAESRKSQAEVATLQQELVDLQAKRTDRGIVLTIGDFLFDTGQATLKPGAVTDTIRLAEFLKENPNRRVLIEGHTDSTGSMRTNATLSQRRADTVADTLAAAGVPWDRMVATGMGPDYPVASNATAAGRQQNRRVEVVIENALPTMTPAASL